MTCGADGCRPTSELPKLQYPNATYRGEHAYTLLQIVLTAGIFAITFTPGAPVFPIIIVMLVPVRLRLMSKFWNVDTLKGVDSWACRPGLGNDFRSRNQRQRDADVAEENAGNSMHVGNEKPGSFVDV